MAFRVEDSESDATTQELLPSWSEERSRKREAAQGPNSVKIAEEDQPKNSGEVVLLEATMGSGMSSAAEDLFRKELAMGFTLRI